MRDLAVGASIRVSPTAFEPVLGFFDRAASPRNDHCRIHMEGGRTLRLTLDHLVHVEGRGFTRARSVVVGDVMTTEGACPVARTEQGVEEGAYSPAVRCGALMVDGVLCSAYAKPRAFAGVRVSDETVHRLCHLGGRALHWSWLLGASRDAEKQQRHTAWLKAAVLPLVVGVQWVMAPKRVGGA